MAIVEVAGVELNGSNGLSVGQRVYASNNVVVSSRGGHATAVRWGAPGTVESLCHGSSSAVVRFDHREDKQNGTESAPLQMPTSKLSQKQPLPLQGTWVQLAVDVHFYSSKVLQKGTPALILDIRDRGPALSPTYVVRTAPMNIQSPMEFSVDASEVEDFTALPEGLPPCVGDLPDGLQFADLVYCKKDVHIQAGDPPQPLVVVGRGDPGIVFAQAKTEQAKEKGEVQVRFELRRDNGRAIWLSLGRDYISKEPPLCAGRRVRLANQVVTSTGTMLQAGRVGTLLDLPTNGDKKDTKLIVRLDSISSDEAPISFVATENGLTVVKEVEMLTNQEKLNRIAQLEYLANFNAEAGDPLRTISLLEQNFWPLTSYGSGIGVSFTCSSMWERTALIANSQRCLLLRERAVEGLDGTLSGESKTMFNHKALIGDSTRVNPYRKAIEGAAKGRKAVDIGTGPVALLSRLCLLAGATSVDAVEVNSASVEKAYQGLDAEAHADSKAMSAFALPPWASLEVADVRKHADVEVGLAVSSAMKQSKQQLDIYQGLSSDPELKLPGGYTMLVHEILGDQAGTEGAAMVLDDIHKRGLCAKDCVFVPKRSSTLLAPTFTLKRSNTEILLHRWGHNGEGRIAPRKRYSARNFHRDALMADPQPLEVLDFQNGPAVMQEHTLEFRTREAGAFDGMHLHMLVNCDEENVIDTLALHTSELSVVCSWNTTYVVLLEEPLQLPAGSRIVFKCVADLVTELATYTVDVLVGEAGAEEKVADFRWQGG
mmetsp:Transcript_66984/g.160472  ORF Transcript_66984/g.160472 Transcript_66984/m.160472 type:complete len:769 (-) Transcript_66984:85-2391(-)